jgi:hypothetical protein
VLSAGEDDTTIIAKVSTLRVVNACEAVRAGAYRNGISVISTDCRGNEQTDGKQEHTTTANTDYSLPNT